MFQGPKTKIQPSKLEKDHMEKMAASGFRIRIAKAGKFLLYRISFFIMQIHPDNPKIPSSPEKYITGINSA